MLEFRWERTEKFNLKIKEKYTEKKKYEKFLLNVVVVCCWHCPEKREWTIENNK